MAIKDLLPWNWGRSEETAVPVRREARDPLDTLRSDLGRAFETFWDTVSAPAGWSGSELPRPRVEVSESEHDVEITAELPGMDAKDVEVSIAEDVLTLKGERRAEREDRQRAYILRETSYGAFQRSIPLPPGVDPDGAKATFRNGVLTVTVPKTAAAQAEIRRIPVRAG